jgi:surface protein
MGRIFYFRNFFNADLSKWDVSRVTTMKHMFYYASSFKADLSKWKVSQVLDMRGMFHLASLFNTDLSKWDVSRVIDMRWMFAYANSFQQTLCGAAWVKSKASKVDMFTHSLGSISDTVCVFSPQSRDELKRAVDDCQSDSE